MAVESSLRREAGAVVLPANHLAPMRLLGAAVTALLMFALDWDRSAGYDNSAYTSVVLSLGLAHYAASFLYAGKPLGKLASTRAALIALVGLLALNLAAYFKVGDKETALLLYFGIHHVCNEVYISHRATGPAFGSSSRLRATAIVLNTVLYAAILSHERFIAALFSAEALAVAMLVAGAIYVYELKRTAPLFTPKQLLDLASVELLGFVVAATVLIFDVPVRFLDVVFYHFVFWALFPIAKLARGAGWRGVRRYATANSTLILLAFAASPFGVVHYELGTSWFLQAFFFLSFLHISASFAISDQHPAWIIRLFRPGAPVLAAGRGR